MPLTGNYDELMKKVRSYGQEHVFEYWDRLLDSEKQELIDDLTSIDFELLRTLYSGASEDTAREFSPAPFIALPKTESEQRIFLKAKQAGEEYISSGKTAAFLVAGGQGSRLGYDGPKGKFPIGPVSGKSLFRLHAERIRATEKKYGTVIPFLIMTSRDNHNETETYFRKNSFFGLNPMNIHIFPQNMIPSLDLEGRLILSEPNRVFMNPDGHGGSLTALRTSGALKKMDESGIKTISYFQVDNPLVNIIDPVFIGFHVLRGADISSKALKKSYPEEKTGVFVRFADGTTGIVEYSDMPEEKIYAKDSDGELLYRAANPAIHIFELAFVSHITEPGNPSLPFHTARKKITGMKGGVQTEFTGYKFEKFVFDALPMTEKNIILETLRDEEFAPVKNASGQDSPESAKNLICGLYRGWLKRKGIAVPERVRGIEISSMYALSFDDLPEQMTIPDQEMVLIE